MMLSDKPAERFRQVAAEFTRIAESVTDWDAPAPVAGWQARSVVDHLTGWSTGLLGNAGVQLEFGPGATIDPLATWRTHCRSIQALLDDPGTAEQVVDEQHMGAMPLARLLNRIYTPDVFMHSWDLAQAAEVPVTLDPDFCQELLSGMQAMEPAIRSSGHYGQAVEVSPEADVQTKLIAFIGRDPHWRASA